MYELRLVKGNNFITLCTGSFAYCNLVLKWYKSHKDFFNGDFIIIYLADWSVKPAERR